MSNALTLHGAEAAPLAPVESAPTSGDILTDAHAMRHALQMSATLSRSVLVPERFRGKPEDVFAAIVLARSMREELFTVLNAVHFVGGKPGWAAQFLIARANRSGTFKGPLSFETTGEGASLAVTCRATIAATGERVERTVSLAMAKADGWAKNAKYSAIPEQMLSYRAATFLIRLYCPEILFGYRPSDELEDIEAARPSVYTAPRPAQARSLGVESDSAAGPSLAASTAPSHREAPTSTGAQAVEAALGPEELTDGQQLERAAYVETLLRMDESRRKRAVEAAGCAGIPRKALTLAQIRAIVQASIEPWEGPTPTDLIGALVDLTIDLEPYGAQLLIDCARAAGLPIDQGEPVVDGAPEPALLRYLSALRGRAVELGVGR